MNNVNAPPSVKHLYRTHSCGELRREHSGEVVRLSGRLSSCRRFGKLLFLDLTDQDGITQVLIDSPSGIKVLQNLPKHTSLRIDGWVALRPDCSRNPLLATGDIEVVYSAHAVLAAGEHSREFFPGGAKTILRRARALASIRRVLGGFGIVELSESALALPRLESRVESRTVLVQRTHQLALAGFDRWFAILGLHLHMELSFAEEEDIIGIIQTLLQVLAPEFDYSWIRSFQLVNSPFALPRGDGSASKFDLVVEGEVLGEGLVPNPSLVSLCAVMKQVGDLDARAQIAAMEEILPPQIPPHAGITLALNRLLDLVAGIELEYSWRPMRDWKSLVEIACGTPTEAICARLRILEMRDCAEIATRLLESRLAEPSEPLGVLQSLLPRFSMSEKDAITLLDLFPILRGGVLAKSPEQVFQFIWSLLGNENVKFLLSDPEALVALRGLIARGVVTDYKQLAHLNAATLKDLHAFLENRPEKKGIAFLRSLLATSANDFSTFVQTLVLTCEPLDHIPMLLDSVNDGFSTPNLFRMYAAIYPDRRQLFLLRAAIQRTAVRVLANRPLDSGALAHAFREATDRLSPLGADALDDAVTCELLYFIFKPINMDFREMTRYFDTIPDRVHDLEVMGMSFGGSAWDEGPGCYRFPLVDVYPSKNRSSFFAKASAGICTAADVDLFVRADHFHLNLVDCAEVRVVGNAQAYILEHNNTRVLLLRGINPAASYVTVKNAGAIVRAILVAAVQMAANSGLDEVHLSESLGIWNADSGRAEIRIILESLCSDLPVVELTAPFQIFTFGTNKLAIRKTFCLWKNRR
jgi:hypothetical protein